MRLRGHVTGRVALCLPTVRSRACVDTWTSAESGGSFQTVVLVTVLVLGLSEEDIPGSRSRDIGYGFVDLGRPGWEQLESMG